MRDLGPSAGPEPCHCLFQKNPIISNGHVGLLLFSLFNLQHTIFPNWPLFSSAITSQWPQGSLSIPPIFQNPEFPSAVWAGYLFIELFKGGGRPFSVC
jgi:hypothetical protein